MKGAGKEVDTYRYTAKGAGKEVDTYRYTAKELAVSQVKHVVCGCSVHLDVLHTTAEPDQNSNTIHQLVTTHAERVLENNVNKLNRKHDVIALQNMKSE